MPDLAQDTLTTINAFVVGASLPSDRRRGPVATAEEFIARHDEPSAADDLIADEQFMRDVSQLKAIRSYMIRHAKIVEAGPIELGPLNLLRFDAAGRLPTQEEWTQLERLSSELCRHLPEQDRRRFVYGQMPAFAIKTAGALGALALAAVVAAVAAHIFLSSAPEFRVVTLFASFLAWVGALGGIGSIAFIGMNAPALQDDATFDITNEKLIGLRVVLGALLAVVLTLPFGFAIFQNFLSSSTTEMVKELPPGIALNAVLLLLPFIFGFGASLVIMILNQFVEAVQLFFGRRSGAPPAPIAPPAAQAPAQTSKMVQNALF